MERGKREPVGACGKVEAERFGLLEDRERHWCVRRDGIGERKRHGRRRYNATITTLLTILITTGKEQTVPLLYGILYLKPLLDPFHSLTFSPSLSSQLIFNVQVHSWLFIHWLSFFKIILSPSSLLLKA